MKTKVNLYAPLFFGSILILAGVSSLLLDLILQFSDESFLSGTIVQLLVYLLPLSFYLRGRSLNVVSALKLRYVSTKKVPFLLVMSLILFVGIIIFRYFGLFFFPGAFLETPAAVQVPLTGENTFLIFLCSVILPAVLEEVVFRSVLLEEYRVYGAFYGVITSSLMYAMVHLSLQNFLYYFFVGLVLALITVSSDTIVPALILHVGMNFSYFNLRPVLVEYLRQAGKSPLLLYLILAVFLVLIVMMFARLEEIYQDQAFDELLRSRRELLRQEVEKTRGVNQPEEAVKNPMLLALKEIYLSPTFLGSVVVFIGLLFGIFS